MKEPKDITAHDGSHPIDASVFYEETAAGDMEMEFVQDPSGSIKCTRVIFDDEIGQGVQFTGDHNTIAGTYAEVIAKYMEEARQCAEQHLSQTRSG